MKIIKNICKIIIMIIFICVLTNISFAATDPLNIYDFTGETTTTSANVASALGDSLGVIQLVALTVAVVMLVALAIKYMMSSVSDRADIKKYAVIYVVGAVLMFGATGIIQIIKDFTDDVL